MPIITLIDILAILLIFFIVTTTFKKRESLVKVNLPKSSEIAAEVDGAPRVALFLSKDGEVSLGSEVIEMDSLPLALLRFSETSDAELELKADEGAPLGQIVEVWDAVTKAGLKISELPLRILLDD